MKRFFILTITFLITGCNSVIKPPTTPTNFSEFVTGATQIALTTSPTQSASPTSTPEKIELSSQVIFRDDFDTNLNPEWMWLNEDTTKWSLTKSPGLLQIDAVGGYFNLGNANNVLLLSAPQSNFILETSLLFDPEKSDQFAGLIAIESATNYVQAGIGYCPQDVGCNGRGFNIDFFREGKLTLPRNTTQLSHGALAVRLVFNNGKLQVFTSFDRTTWYRVLETALEFNIHQVGLIAAQNNDSEPEVALFDFFEIRTITP